MKKRASKESVQNTRQLTDVELFYIKNNKNKSLEQLSAELGVSVDTIKEQIPKRQLSYFLKQIKNRSENGRKGITIMTTGASQVGDEHSKNFRKTKKEKEASYIHRPLGNTDAE